MKHIILVLIFLWPAVVCADFRGADDLKKICLQYERFRSNKEIQEPITMGELSMLIDTGRCDGYIASIMDFMSHSGQIEDDSMPDICTPPSTSTWKVLRVFLLYAFEHQEELRNSANSVVQKALIDAFPCDNKVTSNLRSLNITDSFKDAEELQKACIQYDRFRSDKKVRDSISKDDMLLMIDAGRCEGYVTGTMDFLIHSRAAKDDPTPTVCAKPMTSASQALRIFLQYSYKHKEELDSSASIFVQKALIETFSCKKR
jgi:hypothetical protein